MANPSHNLPPIIPMKPLAQIPRPINSGQQVANIIPIGNASTAMDSNNGDNIEDQPIGTCKLLLSPEDTEAVLTLVTLARNRQRALAAAQALGQNVMECPQQEDLTSNPSTDMSSDSASSVSHVSCSSSWNIEKREGDNDDDTSTAEVTPSEKPTKFDCDQCGKYYATSSNLSRHKQTHRSLNSELAQRCRDCNKVYVSMSALAMHALTHRMRHACRECGKHFSRPWLLRGHLRLHTGEKPYKCIVCGKSFADRSNLRAHLQTHSPDKKFECMRCNKTFALKTYLNKHHESACARFANNN